VLINPLNHSTAKQQYSFPKAQRWERVKTQQDHYRFYELPGTKSQIAATIGSGARTAFSKQSLAPPPNHYSYNLEGEFGFSQRKSSKGFNFGLGRSVPPRTPRTSRPTASSTSDPKAPRPAPTPPRPCHTDSSPSPARNG
jgi:hypothetical protein